MVYHGGPIMPTTNTYAIFWLPNGAHFEPGGHDRRYERLISQFFRDVGGTPYYNIVTQYSQRGDGVPVMNGPILNRSTFGGLYVDTRPYPHAGSQSDPLEALDFRDEVVRALTVKDWKPGIDKMFFVFTGLNIEVCDLPLTFGPGLTDKRPCTFTGPPDVYEFGLCDDRDFYMQGGQPVFYGLEPEASVNRCTIKASASPNRDRRADSTIDHVRFDLFESITDPLGTAWYAGETEGGEIADDCYKIAAARKKISLHGHAYLVGGLWSNAQQTCVWSYRRKKKPSCTIRQHGVRLVVEGVDAGTHQGMPLRPVSVDQGDRLGRGEPPEGLGYDDGTYDD
jgi:hypothetical protein